MFNAGDIVKRTLESEGDHIFLMVVTHTSTIENTNEFNGVTLVDKSNRFLPGGINTHRLGEFELSNWEELKRNV